MLDLPTQIQQPRREIGEDMQEVDSSKISYWKVVLLAAIAAASAYGVGFAAYQYFYVSTAVSSDFFGVFSVALGMLLVSFFLSVLFINRKMLLITEALLIMLVLSASFLSVMSLRTLMGAGIMFLLLSYGALAGRREIDSSVRIRFVRTLGVVISRATLGLAILLASMFYDVFLTKPLDEHNLLFPRQLFESGQGVVSKIISPVMGNIDISLSVNDLAGHSVDEALRQDRALSLAAQRDPGIRKQFIERSVGEIQKGFQSMFGVQLDPTQKVSVAIYDALIGKFNAMTPEQRSGIVVGMAVLFAFAIQAASAVLRLLLIPIAFVVYELCIMSRFVRVSFESKSKEIIVLP